MSGFMKFFDILIIISGILCIASVFIFEAEGSTALLLVLGGAGLILWSSYTLYKETRDTSKKGEISKLSKEREEISKKLKKEN